MKILFQGDSITDGGRDRSDCHHLGGGYAYYAAREIQSRHPYLELEFINYGLSGRQTGDLVACWKEQCIDLQPDFVSVLIGVNDTWHRAETKEWLPNAKLEENYQFILEEIKRKTNAKILMMEQFLLPAQDKDFFREDVFPKILITRKLARQYADAFIPLDGIFAAACVERDAQYWSEDGVHPTVNSCKLMGTLYANAFDHIYYKK